jgi:hypothetical protein
MQQRILRALALAACALTPACLVGSLPASSANIVPSSVYGNAVWGNFLGNHTVGGAGRYKVALRGQTPFAGCFDRLEVYFIASPNNPGYSKGDGGDIRVSVQTLNANDLPSGTVVGAPAPTYSPNLNPATGALRSGQTVAGTLFPELRLAAPACLAAGQKFAVVFENRDPDPSNNYLGVETLGVKMPKNSAVVDPIWAAFMQSSGGSWFKRVWADESHVPIIRLCTSSGGCIVQTYMQNAGAKLVGGTAKARQLMTPPTSLTVRSCKLTLARARSSATTVRVGLATTAGAYLNGGSAYKDVSISALPVVSSGLRASEVTATFPAPVTLTAGVQYALTVTSATSGGVWAAPVQDGVGYFNTTSGFGGTRDWAQYSSGTSWTNWNATLADLQFYCLP